MLITVVAGVLAGCAKVDGEGAVEPSRDPTVTYVAAKLIPTGKTIRSAVADGSITVTEVPGDIISDEAVLDTRTIECRVAVRSLPEGTLLRTSMFVDAAGAGLDHGYSDGTTVDPEC